MTTSRNNKNVADSLKKLQGKTIKKITVQGVNSVIVHTSDGSRYQLEVEGVIPHLGLYGLSLSNIPEE